MYMYMFRRADLEDGWIQGGWPLGSRGTHFGQVAHCSFYFALHFSCRRFQLGYKPPTALDSGPGNSANFLLRYTPASPLKNPGSTPALL